MLVGVQTVDAQVGLRMDADGDNLGLRAAGQRQHVRIVGVEHGQSQARQRLQQAAFLLGDGRQRAEGRQVRLADGCDYAHLWLGQSGQVADLVEAVGGQLQHGQLVLRLQFPGGDGQPVAAIDAAPVVEHRAAAVGQHRRDQLLGRALAGRAGNSDRGQIWPLQDVAGIGRQRGACVGHDHAGHAVRGQVERLLAEHAARAAGDGVAGCSRGRPLFRS